MSQYMLICSHRDSHPDAQTIIYRPPRPSRLRFISLTPTLGHANDAKAEELTDQLCHLEDPLSSTDNDASQANLQQAIDRINASYEGRKLLRTNLCVNPTRASQLSSRSWAPRWLAKMSLSLTGNAVFAHFEAFAQLSITGRQLTTRCRQVVNMPARFHEIVSRTRPIRETSAMYTEFYNTVWLIANDIIVGWTIGVLLRDFSAPVARIVMQLLHKYAIDIVIAGLNWLDDWPVGLKLVTPVSKLYCGSLSDLALLWRSAVTYVEPSTEFGIRALSWISCFGGTFCLAVLGDCFALATAHLWLSRQVTSYIYRWELGSLYSLWNLFRGE